MSGTVAIKARGGKASRTLASLKSSLAKWLGYRSMLTVGKTPPSAAEQRLANHLFALLSEELDASQLPRPDLRRDPFAAVKLAQIVLQGRLPSEASGPAGASGFPWTVAIIAGAAFLAIATVTKNVADVAKEEARLQCIREGKCTDWPAWLPLVGIAAAVWFAWEKMGVKQMVMGGRHGGRALTR